MALQSIEVSQIQIDGNKEYNLADTAVRERVASLEEKQTAVAYIVTINKNNWSNNNNSVSITELKCGSEGNTPPIIFPMTNISDYRKIIQAEATAGTGINFKVSSGTTVTANIQVCIVDFG